MNNWPLYNCHKQVTALKIASIANHPTGGGADIIFTDPGYPHQTVDGEFMAAHKPQVAGYLVSYQDGYLSFSPAAAFEGGYTLIVPGELTFGDAIAALKRGQTVARSGWNGKGMYLMLVEGEEEHVPFDGSAYDRPEIGVTCILPRVDMYTAAGDIQPGWLASQSDMLASDWLVVHY